MLITKVIIKFVLSTKYGILGIIVMIYGVIASEFLPDLTFIYIAMYCYDLFMPDIYGFF